MITNPLDGHLHIKIENRIATIEFGHPASNSFSSTLLEKLTKELYVISEKDDVHIIILKSKGDGVFCAGASFNELISIDNLTDGKSFFSGFANLINAMRKCSKLIIGSVQGKVVGGGVGLASACDYVLATESAYIKLSELTIGIGPFVIAPAVERKIGVAGLSELTLSATEWKSAYWAREKGLYAKVLKTKNDLNKEITLLAEKLVSYNIKALNQMKKTLWEGTEDWDSLLIERAEISGKLVLSDFTKKALDKFK